MSTKFKLLCTFLLLLVGQLFYAQVTGTVVDDDGFGLSDAEVKVEGKDASTFTDFDGNFEIDAEPGDKLIIYDLTGSQKTFAITSNNMGKLKMTNELEEVVVIGYGTQTKEALVGSVGELSEEDIAVTRNPNVVQGAVGKIAGVQVINNTGQPGDGPTVRVRGVGSLYSSSGPLYVVDGVPFNGNINMINNLDIAEFNVLKDATAVSMFGSRGANGVIIITTKKGKEGDLKASIDMSGTYMTRGVPDYDMITDPGQYYQAFYQASRNFLYQSGFNLNDASTLAARNLINDNDGLGYALGYNIYNADPTALIDPSTGMLNNNGSYLWNDSWNDNLFNDSFSNKLFLNLRGGSNKMRTYFSIGYEDNNSYAVNSDFQRTTMNLNIEQDLTDAITIGGNVLYANTEQNAPDQSGYASQFGWSRNISPIYPVFGYELDGTPIYDAAGNHVYDFGDQSTGTPISRPYGSPQNPVATALNDIKELSNDNFSGRAFGSLKFLKDFKLTLNMAQDLRIGNEVDWDTPIGGDAANAGGRSRPRSFRNSTWTSQQLLNWDKTFNVLHNFEFLAGHEYMKWKFTNLNTHVTNFLFPDRPETDFGVVVEEVGNYVLNYSVEGYFARFNYNFDKKYYFTANFRRDASSVFSPENRWGTFWGVGGSWVVSKENFMSNVNWLNYFKLKSSYGEVGNDAIFYPSTSTRNYLAYEDQWNVVLANGNIGIQRYSLGNKDLTWETSKNMNFGFEMAFIDNRFTVDFEYFTRKISGLLFNRPPIPSEGLPAYPENIGNMENKGYEITLGAELVRKGNWSWSIFGNGTTYDNKVTKLPKADIDFGAFRLNEGESRFEYFMREFAGVNPNNGQALFYKDELDSDGNPTGERVLTENYSEADEYYVGKSALPDWYGGFGTEVNYKNLNFRVNFAFQSGGYGRDTNYTNALNGEPGENYHKDIFSQTWTPENPNAALPMVTPNDQFLSYGTSSMQLIDASYLSLQDISISYTLRDMFQFVDGIDNITLYTSANNVKLWSKRKGYDPRLSLTGYNDGNSYSLLRSISFGATINF